MLKRLKFVVEQWVLFMVRRQKWQAWRFEIFESAHHFRIKSNRDVQFEFELNLEASQVPTLGIRKISILEITSANSTRPDQIWYTGQGATMLTKSGKQSAQWGPNGEFRCFQRIQGLLCLVNQTPLCLLSSSWFLPNLVTVWIDVPSEVLAGIFRIFSFRGSLPPKTSKPKACLHIRVPEPAGN